jgi:ribosomal-protein-alanine N-acetyltransferase
MMQESLPTPEKPWNQRWAILLRPLPGFQEENAKPRMIGVIGIVREQEIGYKVHPDFWGKGYMTEALRMFIDVYWKMEGKISFFLGRYHTGKEVRIQC